MKALIWKELRQLAPWAALMWLAGVLASCGVMFDQFEGHHGARLFTNDLFALFAFGSAAIALALGFLQTALEVRRDQWAFLLHRGLSASQVFLGKAAAGLLVYGAVVLTSTCLVVLWARAGGVERYPFSWYQTLPLLATILTAPAFYFAAMLAVVWKGPWYVGRVLPLVAPSLMLFGILGIVFEITEYIPFFVFVSIGVGLAVLAVAARGVFVRSGEAAGRPRWGSICLGITLSVATACAVGGLLGITAVAYEWCLSEWIKYDHWRNIQRSGYVLNRDGHVLRLVSGPGPEQDPWNLRIQSVTDLDRPEDNKYAALIGQPLSILNSPERAPAWDALVTTGVWYRYDHPFGGTLGRGGRTAVLEHLGQTNAVNRRTDWIYSSADGWIYGYLNESEFRDGRHHRQPPRLIHVIGPDGFTDAAHRPARRFGMVRASSGSYFRGYTWAAWPELARGGAASAETCYLLCDDGLYVVDTLKQDVRQPLIAREGHRIRSLALFDAGVAVVYDDLVAVHAAEPVPLGTRRKTGDGVEEDVVLDLPGELRYSFPLPDQVTRFERFDMGRLPEAGLIAFRAMGISSLGTNTRFVTMNLDGTGMRIRDFPNDERLPPEGLPILCGTALFVPAAPLFLGLAFDAVQRTSAGTGSGLALDLLRQFPAETTLLLIALCGSALFCRWSAGRTSRRYGFDPVTRRTWQWLALCLGPIGLWTLWLLRDWPAMEPCAVCSQRRPVDRDACPHCGHPPARPAPNGTEIVTGGNSTLATLLPTAVG